MDKVICSQCGTAFPRYEEIKENGRSVEKDWTLEDRPLCPKCRGVAGAIMPKHDILGGFRRNKEGGQK